MVSKSKTKNKSYKSIKQEMLVSLKENDDGEEQGHKEKPTMATTLRK